MKIKYLIGSNEPLPLGHKKDHLYNSVTFYGYERKTDKSTVFFNLYAKNKIPIEIGLVDYTFDVVIEFTKICGMLNGQLIERTKDGSVVGHSCVFPVEILDSNPDGEVCEVTNEVADRWALKIQSLYDEINEKLVNGEFTPKKGIDYLTEYEKKEFIDEVETPRVVSLDDTYLDCNQTVETVGIPVYVSSESLENYSQFGITDFGWYVFSRVKAKCTVFVEEGFEISGVDGLIEPEIGSDHVDVAIKFGVAAESRKVNINWGSCSESFIFRATDLAIRNLDQRVTYYVYDISDYATWEFALTTDTTVVEGKRYYILEDEEYKLAELTVGDEIPAETYYKHSKVTFEGFPRNISYQTDTVDCPVVIVPPVVEENGYGAWFEIQTTFDGSYSVTVTPKDDSKISTTFVQAPAKGINMLNLQYHMKEKCWMIANNKWAIS